MDRTDSSVRLRDRRVKSGYTSKRVVTDGQTRHLRQTGTCRPAGAQSPARTAMQRPDTSPSGHFQRSPLFPWQRCRGQQPGPPTERRGHGRVDGPTGQCGRPTYLLVLQDESEDLLSLSRALHTTSLVSVTLASPGWRPPDGVDVGTYRLVDVEPGGHPPQNSRVQILRAVRGSHDDHLGHRSQLGHSPSFEP